MLQIATALQSGEGLSFPLVDASTAFASGESIPITQDLAATGAGQAAGTADIVHANPDLAADGAAQASGSATLESSVVSLGADGSAQAGGSAAPSADASLDASGSGLAAGSATLESFILSNDITATLPAMSAALSGDMSGRIVGTLPAMTAALSAVQTAVATIDARLTVPTSNLIGGRYEINGRLLAVRASITGVSGIHGTIAATLPVVGPAITALPGASGAIASRLPLAGASVVGLPGASGVISAGLVTLRASVTALRGTSGTIAASIATLSAAMSGAAQVSGSIAARMPLVAAQIGAGTVLDGYVLSLVLNTETISLSSYDAYAFNSMFRFRGATFGANDSGLYRLDDGESVRGRFAHGKTDFGTAQQKRLAMLYAGLRAPAGVEITAETDDDMIVTFIVPEARGTLEQRRVKTAKGQRGRYWKLGMEGDEFECDSLAADVVPLSRRV